MSDNKKIIEKYIEGFNKSDHEQILACLTDNIVWDIPGFIHLEGKTAFDGEIENPAFVGRPSITLTRMTEENDVIVAEGTVRSKKKDDSLFNAVFCDVFVMEKAKIKHVISYLAELK